jgi:hypothetical protein
MVKKSYNGTCLVSLASSVTLHVELVQHTPMYNEHSRSFKVLIWCIMALPAYWEQFLEYKMNIFDIKFNSLDPSDVSGLPAYHLKKNMSTYFTLTEAVVIANRVSF